MIWSSLPLYVVPASTLSYISLQKNVGPRLISWSDGSDDPDFNPDLSCLPSKRPYATLNEIKQPINTHERPIDLDFLTNVDEDFGLMGFEDFDFSVEFPLPV